MESIGENNIEIMSTTKGKLPRLPFVLLKNAILGKRYELSIAFVSKQEMKKLSIEHKGDPTHMNILSFPLDTYSGEIIMNLEAGKAEAKNFDHTQTKHLIFLLIHGMLHLKGHTHGHEMEKLEKKFLAKFS
jgi:probable rRNA maturation factor